MAVDERNVDRELAVALQELLGAVERVDEPIALPLAPRRRVGWGRLLGQDGQTRRELFEGATDDRVGHSIGFRQRRIVALALDGKIRAAVNLENRLSGFASNLASCIE
jgi:hypothetical protein